MLAVAEARARGLKLIGGALAQRVCNFTYSLNNSLPMSFYLLHLFYYSNYLFSQDSKHAASLTLAEQYVSAFNKLARTNNTLILPANAGDVSNLVAQVLT